MQVLHDNTLLRRLVWEKVHKTSSAFFPESFARERMGFCKTSRNHEKEMFASADCANGEYLGYSIRDLRKGAFPCRRILQKVNKHCFRIASEPFAHKHVVFARLRQDERTLASAEDANGELWSIICDFGEKVSVLSPCPSRILRRASVVFGPSRTHPHPPALPKLDFDGAPSNPPQEKIRKSTGRM